MFVYQAGVLLNLSQDAQRQATVSFIGSLSGAGTRWPIACSPNQLQPRPGALRVVRWPCTAPWCSPTVQG